MLAAQHVPMGAKICTTRAIRTTGKKFFSRLRIANPSDSDLITLRVRCRDQVPGFIFHCCGNKPAAPVYRPLRAAPSLPDYLPRGSQPGDLQLAMANSQSFRRLLEF